MIETLYGLDNLASQKAFLVSLLIGLLFGIALERAGFGSSRRLAGIFYFRDMAVLKVMFTAVVVAMLGLLYLNKLGWLGFEQLYYMPTIYGAAIIGGLIFGVGFVMGGWCPGTAAVGLASGKLDAIVFLLGAMGGSVLFNEIFGLVKPLYGWGDSGVRFVWQSLGMSDAGFALLFVLAAVGCFWLAEWIEKKKTGESRYLHTPFLRTFSVMLPVLTVGLFVVAGIPAGGAGEPPATPTSELSSPVEVPSSKRSETALLEMIDTGSDHVEPEELADMLMQSASDLLVVDVRSPEEFAAFHIRGAVHVPLSDLPSYLAPHCNQGRIVLYSNGMTHPAQARDALFRSGFTNVYILTDGLQGFVDRCLKPLSLRNYPVDQALADRIQLWRNFFYATQSQASPTGTISSNQTSTEPSVAESTAFPGVVTSTWLGDRLGLKDLCIIDCRPQPAYNGGHIPGSVCLSPESVRTVVGGVSSMLMPAEVLVTELSVMGIKLTDTVVLVPDDKLQDATLIGMALERVAHKNWALLHGGFTQWKSEKLPLDTLLPDMPKSTYLPSPHKDDFTVDSEFVRKHAGQAGSVILDVRPAEYYTGQKSDEARAGHIPGAVNRPYTQDLEKSGEATVFKPIEELAQAYTKLIPSKDTTVIIHCRTGHQASQTYFVLKHLLKYQKVYWYDAGWSEWASRPELPVELSLAPLKEN